MYMESTENSDVCLTLSSNRLQLQKFPSDVTIIKLASLSAGLITGVFMLWNHYVVILDSIPLSELFYFVFDVSKYLKVTNYLNVFWMKYVHKITDFQLSWWFTVPDDPVLRFFFVAVSCVANIPKQHDFSIFRVRVNGGESIWLCHLIFSNIRYEWFTSIQII